MTTRQWFGSVIAVILLGVLVSAGAFSAHAQKTKTTTTVTKTKVAKVTKTGWWIRIDTQKTVASSISFQAGMTRADRHDWRTWTAGEPAEFDLPADLRNLPKLHLHGRTDPKSKDAVFCVFFQNHGVEHFKFDGDKDDNMESKHSDNDCKP
jgi:hypothetical protein